MEKNYAIEGFAALAHGHRLDIIRELVRAGEAGLPAGKIAERLDLRPNTASNNLNVLTNAGLVHSRREGRSIRYFARFDTLGALLTYLMEDCCGGQVSACLPPRKDTQ